MIPINNSDIAWLITADYNQDNDIGFPEALRQDVLNPEINEFTYEHYMLCVLKKNFLIKAGGNTLLDHWGNSVGADFNLELYGLGEKVGWNSALSMAVGGN